MFKENFGLEKEYSNIHNLAPKRHNLQKIRSRFCLIVSDGKQYRISTYISKKIFFAKITQTLRSVTSVVLKYECSVAAMKQQKRKMDLYANLRMQAYSQSFTVSKQLPVKKIVLAKLSVTWRALCHAIVHSDCAQMGHFLHMYSQAICILDYKTNLETVDTCSNKMNRNGNKQESICTMENKKSDEFACSVKWEKLWRMQAKFYCFTNKAVEDPSNKGTNIFEPSCHWSINSHSKDAVLNHKALCTKSIQRNICLVWNTKVVRLYLVIFEGSEALEKRRRKIYIFSQKTF